MGFHTANYEQFNVWAAAREQTQMHKSHLSSQRQTPRSKVDEKKAKGLRTHWRCNQQSKASVKHAKRRTHISVYAQHDVICSFRQRSLSRDKQSEEVYTAQEHMSRHISHSRC